jgi:uncharacterized protein
VPRRINEDHQAFHDVYAGRIRKELKKFINNGSIFRTRGDGKKINITIPRIDIPHIVFGSSDDGVGRGKGKKGDVIGKDDDGKDKGKKAGQEQQDGVVISLDLEQVLKFLQNELKLPDLKPKPSEVFDEVKIKYNDVSLQGPESLRHNRRTMLQALKRMCASGEIHNLHEIPGFAEPVRMITPINSDRRYRQYKEIRMPSSNAVIFFARDGSGSMDEYKCDIVSDMCWWVDVWIRQFYKRVERCYIWHDVEAEEVDEHKFYNYRYGGGTTCSSALKLIHKQLENRYPPHKWNIYVFYFSDGENWDDDNNVFNKVLKEKFGPEVVNFVGITQILAWNYDNTLKAAVDGAKLPNVRTTSIGPDDAPNMSKPAATSFYGGGRLSEDERDKQIRRAIMDLLGAERKKTEVLEVVQS